ncbi:type VI secretion system ImpA family N-terminal domain-containing protein [Thioclava sp. GXIMD4216]|uniref:type VI secretion system protein TssA n=1 Tax=Thioclava sp. GXIMD4216 TaxID=3131929 RepID=UPI0030CA9457
MNMEKLLTPVSAEAPCGADLSALMDPDYDEYYFGALGRLPDRYFVPGVSRPDGSLSPDRVFDPSEVDLAAELKQIDTLLARSRDLRLLVLRAQWQALAGRLLDLPETFETIAALMKTFGDDLHPSMQDGPSERREALNDLAAPVTMVQALQFAGLTGSTEVTLRKLRVASGELTALQNEQDLDGEAMTSLLADAGQASRVEKIADAVDRVLAAIAEISAASLRGSHPITLGLTPLTAVLTQIYDVLAHARPGMVRRADQDIAQAAAEPAPEIADPAPQPVPSAPVNPAAGPRVESHDHARAVLEKVEQYYRQSEPSSAALVLVTQARLLIGKSLLEAIETLMPNRLSEAHIDFGPATGFVLDSARLQKLSATLPETAVAEKKPPLPAVADILDGQKAAEAIAAVEAYFRRSEKSSPVPLLLARAASYIGRDFQGILKEFLTKKADG